MTGESTTTELGKTEKFSIFHEICANELNECQHLEDTVDKHIQEKRLLQYIKIEWCSSFRYKHSQQPTNQAMISDDSTNGTFRGSQ